MAKAKGSREHKASWMGRATHLVRRYFTTGIAVLFPIVVSAYVIVLVFRFADGLLGRFINTYLLRLFGYTIPGLGIILTLALILVTGFLTVHFFGHTIIPWFERWLVRFPLIRHIYPSAKQLIDFVLSERRMAFKEAVLIEFPQKGQHVVGFITCEDIRLGSDPREYVAVLMANVPNPFSGFVLIVPRESVMPMGMSVEEAVKLVVTGGMLTPSRITRGSS